MGLFDHFPYTNVHELNLDWLLTMMKALEAEWDAFTAGNSLTFADPLQHDMSKTYAKNTIVIDGSGNAYVSLQAVPVGVGLGNQDYWLMVFDYEAFIEKVNKNFTARYYRGSYRATTAMAIGDWLTVDDVLCKATAAIDADDTLEVGVNIEHFTLEDFIKAFMQSANQLIQQYKNDIDASELLYRQQLAQDIADTTASLQAQLDAAISGVTVDSEVINARVGADGVTYPTLGDAIRTQIGRNNDFIGYITNDIINDNVSDTDIFSTFTNNSSAGISYSGGVLTVPAGEYAVFFHREYGAYTTQNITFKSSDYPSNTGRFRIIAGSTSTPGSVGTDVAATLVNNKTVYAGELPASDFVSPNVYFKFVVDNRTGTSTITVSDIKASLGLYIPYAADLSSIYSSISDLETYVYDSNFLDPQVGYVRWASGTFGSDSSYNRSFVGVAEGSIIKYKTQVNESIVGLAIYDVNGNYLTGLQAQATEQTITAPSGSAYMYVSFRPAHLANTYLKVYTKLSTVFTTLEKALVNIAADTPEFICGSSDIAVVGHEWNCYFNGIVKGYNPMRYSIGATISPSLSAKLYERCLRITPAVADVGSYTITLTLRDNKNYSLIDSTQITLKVINDSTITSKKVLFIGDSLTDNGTYPAEIENILSSGGIESVGTRSSTITIGGISYTVNHEGRSGWAAYDYTRSVPNYKTDYPNPFWDGSKFDFSYYIANSGVSVPDVVCIALGTNGRTDGVSALQTMVNSIHSYDANMPILITLVSSPADQNGCGNHTGLQSSADLKVQILDTNESYISEYDNNASRPYADIVNLAFALDYEYDYPTTQIAASARNPELITIQNNNVHPSQYGYLHFADSFYGKLLNIFTS